MATTTAKPETLVGKRIRRREDPRLITGTATYVEDIKMPGMHFAMIVRSPHAAAKIRSIDTSKAAATKGVVAIFTGKDVANVGTVPCGAALPGLRVPHHTILAQDRVYLVGHPVAVVVATDRYIAKDAADLVEVDYEVLPAVADPEKALEKGAPAVHPEWPDNIAFTFHQEGGEVDKAFAEADVVVKQRITSQRLVPMAMETRGVVADWRGADRALTIYTSTQVPHLVRTLVAAMLGLEENRLRVVAPEVGGGFGSKLNVYAEEALMGFVAMKINKPVKWIESRRENFTCTIHGRGHVDYYEVAAKKDGTILGIKLKIIQDLGAFHQLLGPAIPTLSVLMAPGLYRTKTVSADIVGVFTNCTPTDAYRGAGRPEATHAIERMVDILATELKMDPAEVRMKNFVQNEEFPFPTATGLMYDSGDYAAPLKKALELVDYKAARDEQAKQRQQGRLMGIGICTYGEICAMGPSPATPAGGWESATVKIEPSGKVTVMTGVSPHGQGEETTFAQIAADELGVDIDDVLVLHGDTAIVQYGIGTFGSRATAVGGAALYFALQDLKAKLKKFGAVLLDSEDVSLEGGQCTCNRTGKTVSFQKIAFAAHRALKLPPNTEPGLVSTHFWEPPNFTFPFGAHIVITEVDRETGDITLKRYVAVDDCGRILNPLIVDGQLHGGVAQGLGQALFEQAVYDDNGQLVTGELMDYAVPRAHMMPWIESSHTVTPSPVNPLGVKGVGEAGTIGCSPAVVNSVVDALAPLGVRHVDMPLTPEKIWKLVTGRAA
ncbi:MAG: xanthine dehydrogenase family protein molybdopterin-binding subunit [Bryobacterales bacterium]|nr:xanthine dehydrogenase family protein molybdopterin-binding subunit [Bryobacterales bacterium]MBV9401732.1 xanthine dehydrogenase family protein molybdopterin-binding subunit [Bryobacterales bacterium]